MTIIQDTRCLDVFTLTLKIEAYMSHNLYEGLIPLLVPVI